jgi:Uma2 family endonuclease
MTALTPANQTTEPFYPSGDGEPVAETFDHLYVLLITLEVLRQYLAGQRATVLGNQFLYYAQGFPRLRLAPDIMVIFNVEPGGRDNYKIWEEGQVPSVIFEITSESTREKDETFKKTLYAQLGVQEYWQFDPKGEWIPGQLRGYTLHEFINSDGEPEFVYESIENGKSQVLHLQLVVEGRLIGLYRLDTGEKLLVPDELAEALEQETQARQQEAQARQQAETRAAELEAKLAQYREKFGELPEG